MQADARSILGKDPGLQRPQPCVVGSCDLAVDQGPAHAMAAVVIADVDRGLCDAGVHRAGGRGFNRGPAGHLPAHLGDPTVLRQPAMLEGSPVRNLGLECGVAAGDALRIDATHSRPVARLQAAHRDVVGKVLGATGA